VAKINKNNHIAKKIWYYFKNKFSNFPSSRSKYLITCIEVRIVVKSFSGELYAWLIWEYPGFFLILCR